MNFRIAAVAALAAMTATAAAAQQPPRHEGPDQAAGRMQSPPNERNGPGRRDRGPGGQHGGGGPGMGMMGDPAKLFGAMDSDRNGSISRSEFDRFHAQAKARMQERMRDGRGPEGRGPEGRGPGAHRPDGRPSKR